MAKKKSKKTVEVYDDSDEAEKDWTEVKKPRTVKSRGKAKANPVSGAVLETPPAAPGPLSAPQ
jgi:hypothetical protein